MTNSPMINAETTPTFFAGRAAIAAAILTGTLGAGSIALADDPTADELLAQIEMLQRQVEKMKANEATAKAETEADAFERVLSDADRRSSKPVLLQNGESPSPFIAGHDGKFVLRSDDGNFELSPNFQLQVRHVANLAPESTPTDNGEAFDDLDFGWEIRRFKVGFKGHAVTPDLAYDFKFAFGRDGGIMLENAFIDYLPEEGLLGNPDLGFRIGQFKDPTFFEEYTSSSRQLAADRSLVNESIGGGMTGFVQGVQLLGSGDRVRWMAGYIDGAGTANTDYRDPAGTDFRAGFNGRVDIVLRGEGDKVFKDFTALGTEEDSARLGFGGLIDVIDGTDLGFVFYHTADFSYETAGGMGLFLAYYGQAFDDGAGTDGYNLGGEAQVSQIIDEEAGWEVFGRYDFVLFENNQVANEDFFHEVVAGVNKYWVDHKVKMTIDVGLLPSGNPGSNTGIGYRSVATDEGQLTIRGQFQLLL